MQPAHDLRISLIPRSVYYNSGFFVVVVPKMFDLGMNHGNFSHCLLVGNKSGPRANLDAPAITQHHPQDLDISLDGQGNKEQERTFEEEEPAATRAKQMVSKR